MPWWREQGWDEDLGERTVVWDNASTHSAVDVQDPTRVSVFHRLFRDWGFDGVVFLPPRSPSFNPAELCFAFLKHWVRKWAPDDGYSQEGLEAAVRAAVQRVTGDMVQNWVRGCGYGPNVIPKRAAVKRMADVYGTLRADGSADELVDITARPMRRPPAPPPPHDECRWPGYPGNMPRGLIETAPKSYVEALVDQETTYEPERIVDERKLDGTVSYRIRWKGYDESGDTWEPLEHLLVGRQQLLRDWKKRYNKEDD